MMRLDRNNSIIPLLAAVRANILPVVVRRRWIAVGMDSRLAIIHNAIINARVLIYREFFQQDVDEFGFEEAVTDQIIDPG
jgi:hypothetical protein